MRGAVTVSYLTASSGEKLADGKQKAVASYPSSSRPQDLSNQVVFLSILGHPRLSSVDSATRDRRKASETLLCQTEPETASSPQRMGR